MLGGAVGVGGIWNCMGGAAAVATGMGGIRLESGGGDKVSGGLGGDEAGLLGQLVGVVTWTLSLPM